MPQNHAGPGSRNARVCWRRDAAPVEGESRAMGIIGLKVRHNESGEVELLEADGVFAAIGHTRKKRLPWLTDPHG
ncbi:hypothetical protein NNL21_27950 [Paenibacillus mendelii]|nr:hypothetical protein [Paenibacillus mendelii]